MEDKKSTKKIPLKRALLRITGFILVLALLVAGASFLVFPKSNGPAGGNPEYQARGFYGEAENSLDAMFIGNSNIYSGISPMELWNDYGYATYACGEVAQTVVESDQLLESILTCQSPKVIIFETSVLFQPTGMIYTIAETLQKYIPLLRYHNRWKYLKWNDWTLKYHYKWRNSYKGYYFSAKVDPGVNRDLLPPTDKVAEITPIIYTFLENFVNTCRDNGIKLVLTTIPAVDWNTEKHNAIAAFAEEYELDFLDLNAWTENIGLDWTTDSRDKGMHLNYNGAKKVTDFLGRYLSENYPLPDRREDPAYASWHEDYKAYTADMEKQKSKTQH